MPLEVVQEPPQLGTHIPRLPEIGASHEDHFLSSNQDTSITRSPSDSTIQSRHSGSLQGGQSKHTPTPPKDQRGRGRLRRASVSATATSSLMSSEAITPGRAARLPSARDREIGLQPYWMKNATKSVRSVSPDHSPERTPPMNSAPLPEPSPSRSLVPLDPITEVTSPLLRTARQPRVGTITLKDEATTVYETVQTLFTQVLDKPLPAPEDPDVLEDPAECVKETGYALEMFSLLYDEQKQEADAKYKALEEEKKQILAKANPERNDTGMQTMTQTEIIHAKYKKTMEEQTELLKAQAEELKLSEQDMERAEVAQSRLQARYDAELEKLKAQFEDEVGKHSALEAELREKIRIMTEEQSKRTVHEPPHGVLTMAFTDIEDSTNLWEWNGKVMKEVQKIHDTIIRVCTTKYFGYEVNTEGDSFQVAFHTAYDAVMWCFEIQQECLKADWPKEFMEQVDKAKEVYNDKGELVWRGLRVRMGIHTGEALETGVDQVTKRTYYKGPFVVESSRMGDCGAGGQVIVSRESMNEITDILVDLGEPQVVHLGEFLLDGGNKPLEILELTPRNLVDRRYSDLRKATKLTQGMYDAPAGDQVTLVFAFVEGSTYLHEQIPKEFSSSVEMWSQLVRNLLKQMRGYECQQTATSGRFMLSFHTPVQAVRFCLAAQDAAMYVAWPPVLEHHDCSREIWSEGATMLFKGLRIKMGILTGAPDECKPHNVTGRLDYFGPIVNRCARISQKAEGGQILMDELSFDLIKSSYKSLGFPTLVDTGSHELKGVPQPERLIEITSHKLTGRGKFFRPEVDPLPILIQHNKSEETLLRRKSDRSQGENDAELEVIRAMSGFEDQKFPTEDVEQEEETDTARMARYLAFMQEQSQKLADLSVKISKLHAQREASRANKSVSDLSQGASTVSLSPAPAK